jgi:ADP-heptose:LPS heptosyltransferase
MLSAGPSDRAAAAAVLADARSRARDSARRILQSERNLAELHALAARASVYIGGDSGPLHMAATTRTPIVGILGPTLAEQSRPWRDSTAFADMIEPDPLPCRPCRQRHCAPGDFRCLTGISPARVLEAVERALTV